ncbi:dihydropteroate synthase [Breoghania corrubedonensis]|uniref:Dihydropteroate synthase n=1 Tax=Breoghania corrubedonensis TaxID=665038 RepID=A0A2T5VH54_9HYPH|nr:dihydropteroate synthase [Breoghania corrubedonensis]PTW63091.1 dihydropteroate synthase [Breoghania corrubedonensis]
MQRLLNIGPLEHVTGVRTLVMGILNVTPDSFSDGGLHCGADAAEAHARLMLAQGADIIDVGGESTRPGAEPISADAEMIRLLPVLAAVRSLGCAISIDTYKADVAAAALGAGAHAINDIWGLQGDPDMAMVAEQTGAPVIVMHNRETVDPAIDIMADMRAFFLRSLEIAAAAGIGREKIILDPGIGFGKTPQQNLIALNRLGALKAHFDLPVLVGASRKRIIGALTGREAHDRGAGSLGAHLAAVAHGADIVRVHDVELHVDAVRVADAIRRESLDPQAAPQNSQDAGSNA